MALMNNHALKLICCHYCQGEEMRLPWTKVCRSCAPIRNRLRARCVAAIGIAITKGALVRPTARQCADCDRMAQVYDHRDYTKPLHVDPVCRSCNVKRGPAAIPMDYINLSNNQQL